MQLWNDYEGKTIAGKYTLGTLLRSEGRSALFTLPAETGAAGVIRVTESINDEGQMLSTWRAVKQLDQQNLLAIQDFGEATFAGAPLTYAVLEPSDASLEDLLGDELGARPLTQPEALQIAADVTAALSALHAAGFVHEHIDADNVFAVGQSVKLRADCVRECVVDNEFVTADDRARLIQKDVHDLGMLLLRGLTLSRTLTPVTLLPAPFNQIVPKAVSGAWGLAEISRTAPPAPIAAELPAAPVPASLPTSPIASRPSPALPVHSATAMPAMPVPAQPTLPYPEFIPAEAASTLPTPHPAADNPLAFQRRIQVPTVSRTLAMPKRTPLAIAAALLVAFFLYLVHGMSSRPAATTAAAPTAHAISQPPVASGAAPPVAPSASSRQLASAAAPEQKAPPTLSSRLQPGWYVIAYTFNHEQQALQRASALVHRYPGLRPQVIAPGGRGAFLVALGGAMSRDQAESIRNHARRAGLPRDTFVRNYGG